MTSALAENVRCPICRRVVSLSQLATNMKGERIMEYHHRENWQRCEGSNMSLRVALAKRAQSAEGVAMTRKVVERQGEA